MTLGFRSTNLGNGPILIVCPKRSTPNLPGFQSPIVGDCIFCDFVTATALPKQKDQQGLWYELDLHINITKNMPAYGI